MTLTGKGLQPLTRIDTVSTNDYLTPQRYAAGTIGDGASRALSTVYGTLAEAQAVYSFVTALTQTLDYAAIQKMSYVALGYPTFEHADVDSKLNKPMFIPAGSYQLGSDTWLVRNASGIRIEGAARRATQLFSSGIVFQTDGLWYSQISGIDFEGTGSAVAVVDIDGNVPGQPYATRGVQANTFKDVFVNGATTYGLAITRQGGAGAQGSENLFLNCHFNGATEACYYQSGANALQNTFIGGNFQGYSKNGIYTSGGDVRIYSVGFQSTYGYTQIVNDGYDINTGNFGVGERVTVMGCRTESLRFFKGSNSQPPILIGNSQNISGDVGWAASTAYSLNQISLRTSATLGTKLYRVSTAGTSGTVEPTWPDSGTVADGTAVWTMTDFFVVDTSSDGNPTLINNGLGAPGLVRLGGWGSELGIIVNTSTAQSIREYLHPHRVYFCDTTSGNQTITVFTGLPLSSGVPDGTSITFKKVTTDANTITLAYSGGNSGESVVIPGGSTGFVTIQYSQNAGVTSKWWVINKSIDRDPQFRRLRLDQGTTLAVGDFALSAGWGTTASVTFSSVMKDSHGMVTVISAGTGQAANPTVTLTFKDGAWPSTPDAIVCRGPGNQLTVPVSVHSISTTALAIKFNGTPVAGEQYDICFWVLV